MAVKGLDRTETCIVHHDRPAAARCGTCHKPVCSHCVVSTADGKYCSHACASKAQDFRVRGSRIKKPARGALSALIKMVFWLAVLVVILGVMNKYAFKDGMPGIGKYLDKLPVLGR